jgi:predicted PurR-regulated permease PerM
MSHFIGEQYRTLDRFLWKVFSVAKVISAVIVTICLVVAIFSGFGLIFGGGKSFETPEFSSLKEVIETRKTQQAYTNNYKDLETKRKIEKEYGDDIEGIVKKYNLPSDAYNIFIKKLINMKEEYRDKFVEGLEDFLDDAQDYIEDKGKESKITIIDAANYYLSSFDNEIQTVEMSKASAQAGKITLLAILGGSLLIMLGFLLIPLLIQIEKNTRKQELSEPQ